MKEILVTQRLIENNTYFEIREALDINYSMLLNKCGFIPIILPYEVDFKSYFKKFEISGVLLTGGNDLNTCNKNDLSLKRDNYEINLIKYCIKKKVSIYGICRGMQILAYYFGCDFEKIDGHINQNHKLITNNKSKYKNYLNSIKEVNSYHNFTLKNLDDNFLISARSEDGVIKAIEHKGLRIFGQMWHTERNTPFRETEINLIKDFFAY